MPTALPATYDVVNALTDLLKRRYVFPDRAALAEATLLESLRNGALAELDGPSLTARLTTDLYAVCEDHHLRLIWHDEPQTMVEGPADDDPVVLAGWRADEEADGHGIVRVERLDNGGAGGVGLIQLDSVCHAEWGSPAIGAAMTLVRHTTALVLDLRANVGGWPEGAATWCSYFFPGDSTHLNDVYDRDLDATRQFWSLPALPGPRYLDRSVYALVSARTFSGGEDIAYTLQAQGRAVVVGETTRGGAHPTDIVQLDPHVSVKIPTARSINPVTRSNWEGVGVVPDLSVPAESALEAALQLAAGARTD
jgi:hypothetical protein